MYRFLLSLLFIASSTMAFAQSEHVHDARCGHDIIMDVMENQFPGYENAVKSTFRRAKENISTSRTDAVYRIPVVVHIVWKEDEENLSDARIFNQIDVLNEDFRALNADLGNLRPEFDGLAADAKIEFDLVAIKRVKTEETFGLDLFTGFDDTKLKISANGGSDAYDTERHMNIWVCNVQPITIFGQTVGQILGLAYPPVNIEDYPDINNFPPGLPTDPEYNGIVIHYPAFGGRERAVNIPNLGGDVVFEGRTTVHEVGHYLGLRHIWGDPDQFSGEDGCSVDDGIEDTPNAADNSQVTGCDDTKNTCTDNTDDRSDMWENYMDYSVETCQVAFTQGQVDIMRAILEGPRADLYQTGSVANEEVENLKSSIMVSPNPTSGLVTLSINNEVNDDYQIIVRDILGSQKMNTVMNNGNSQVELDLSGLSNGVYFVEIQKGNVRAAKKVIVAK